MLYNMFSPTKSSRRWPKQFLLVYLAFLLLEFLPTAVSTVGAVSTVRAGGGAEPEPEPAVYYTEPADAIPRPPLLLLRFQMGLRADTTKTLELSLENVFLSAPKDLIERLEKEFSWGVASLVFGPHTLDGRKMKNSGFETMRLYLETEEGALYGYLLSSTYLPEDRRNVQVLKLSEVENALLTPGAPGMFFHGLGGYDHDHSARSYDQGQTHWREYVEHVRGNRVVDRRSGRDVGEAEQRTKLARRLVRYWQTGTWIANEGCSSRERELPELVQDGWSYDYKGRPIDYDPGWRLYTSSPIREEETMQSQGSVGV